ncbi:MAG: tRNA (adenosine(37)-N6)-threonylcarbamoyltransferase complex dimerization subunit type 1 TsaB [Candidatus Delongbacteria bacterium]
MYILAVETSTENASVCCLSDGKVTADIKASGNYSHNKLLFDMIKDVLDKSAISVKQIDVFAIGTGPGSFTGLRVGAGAVKGMAMAIRKKIIPVPSTDAAALNYFTKFPGKERINIILEGRQKDFFYGEYEFKDDDVVKKNEIIVHPYANSSYIKGYVAGNVDIDNVRIQNYAENIYPEACFVARLAYIRNKSASFDYGFEPQYYKQFRVR